VIKGTAENIGVVQELIRYVFLLGGFPIFKVAFNREDWRDVQDQEILLKKKQASNLNKIMIFFANKSKS